MGLRLLRVPWDVLHVEYFLIYTSNKWPMICGVYPGETAGC